MNTYQNIEKLLLPLNEKEKALKRSGIGFQDHDKHNKVIKIKDEEVLLFDDWLFYGKEKLSIRPHTRFSRVPTHVHSYIELIYVFKGECRQLIKGKEILLQAGDFCLVDKRVPHRILDTRIDDIIVNILLKEDYFTHNFLNLLSDQGLITDFLANVMYGTKRRDSYLVFRTFNDKRPAEVMNKLIEEYYNKDIYSDTILNNYMAVIFTCLLRTKIEWHSNTNHNGFSIVDILTYIKQHLPECTLHGLAAHFHFNSSYLSTLIKKETGYTFSQLIKKEKIRLTWKLLTQTDLTMEQIMAEIGYKNKTFFYNLVRKEFGFTPYVVRKMNRSNS